MSKEFTESLYAICDNTDICLNVTEFVVNLTKNVSDTCENFSSFFSIVGQSDSRSFRYGISASVVLTFLNVCRDESQRILSIRGIATGLQLKRFLGGRKVRLTKCRVLTSEKA